MLRLRVRVCCDDAGLSRAWYQPRGAEGTTLEALPASVRRQPRRRCRRCCNACVFAAAAAGALLRFAFAARAVCFT
jgi:hypothetical protein